MKDLKIDLLKILTHNLLLSSARIFSYDIYIDETAQHRAGILDKKIFVNPNLLKNIGEAIIVLGHEVIHDLLEHQIRRTNLLGSDYVEESKLVIFNYAADHIVNKMLINLTSTVSSKWDVTSILEMLVNLDYMNDDSVDVNDMSVELLYRFLLDRVEVSNVEISNFSQSRDNQNRSGCQSGDEFNDNQNQNNNSGNSLGPRIIRSRITDKQTGKILHEKYQIIDPGKNSSGKDGENSSDSKNPSSSGALELGQILKSRGINPGGFARELQYIKNPLDLKTELNQYFHTVKCGTDDISFTRYNKLNTVLGLNIGLPSPVSRMAHVMIGIDTSGSISDEEYQSFISIIKGNIQYIYGKIYLADSEISNEFEITRDMDNPLDVIKKMKTRKGYGGTDFEPVLNKAQECQDLDVLIYFTDLGAPFPKLKRKNFKILWVCKDMYYIHKIQIPYGKIIFY